MWCESVQAFVVDPILVMFTKDVLVHVRLLKLRHPAKETFVHMCLQCQSSRAYYVRIWVAKEIQLDNLRICDLLPTKSIFQQNINTSDSEVDI